MTSALESVVDLPAVTFKVIAGPWPSYSNCRHLPERDRWEIYSMAKASRAALEDRGVSMAETYDDFIRRVTQELDI
ncbi:hypothetical protein [Pseudomonas sp. NFACC37-1]|uniref:hypothetical protein n=1 Tax=Pseudomonas sp. NFACC37-1 TaxID=1566196 RepID=UPI00088F19E6|nr:hypothetical protein [Pseudomonas sp. NFACC37-1]SCZ13278.1 hypothetical protein SAMN03159391_05808 [Pseudomonas sp. NFACC37-1]